MKKIKTIILAVSLALPGILQSQDTTALKTRTVQLGFVTPLSSNWVDSWNCTNKFSVNILGGYAGGINGAEFSTLVSVLKTDMKGAQFAGLGNIVINDVKGVQFSGLFNISQGKVKAAQFAGGINLNTGTTKGFQSSLLANINIDTTTGFQASGVLNYCKGAKTSQLSVFTNIHKGDMDGLQIAGFSNINSGRQSGVQIGGIFNYTRKLKGVQIGAINYVDSLEKGTPIGFLSFVKNGYKSFEVSSNETMYGVLSFKTGTRQFYNILSVGGGYRNNNYLFAYGYGIGTLIALSPKVDIGIEGLCYQVNVGAWHKNGLNLLNKLNLTVAWNVARHLTFFGGPSWNVTVSDILDEFGNPIESSIAPWSVFDKTTDSGYNIKMYPGATIGVRF